MKSEGSWSFSQEPRTAPVLKHCNAVNILTLFFKIHLNVIPRLRMDPTNSYIPFNSSTKIVYIIYHFSRVLREQLI
jgi:hypothetical protein